jgi:hypothetical protein
MSELFAKGCVEQLPSGSWRARVYAGVDPVTKREIRLKATAKAHQLCLRQPFRLARPQVRTGHVVVDFHVQCDQEGIQVWRHSRSWMPSSHFKINPIRRTRAESGITHLVKQGETAEPSGPGS